MSAEHTDEHGCRPWRAWTRYGNPPETAVRLGLERRLRQARPASAAGSSVIVLVLMATKSVTHYNDAGTVALLVTAALLVVGLGWDIHRRRTRLARS